MKGDEWISEPKVRDGLMLLMITVLQIINRLHS